MTLILGLTGGIASGKSTVARMFKDEGIPLIDTDLIARNLQKKGTETYNEIIKFFSNDILLTNKEINRKKLGRIIFANVQKRKKLNDIVHPMVKTIVDNEIEKHRELGTKILVVDVPLLFETDYHRIVDKTIVVYTKPEEQLSRLTSRDVITKEYAQMKINAQIPLNEKVDLADYVINNSYSILNTKKDFIKILEDLEV
jgi:dephospho-CoA kinase